MPAYERSRLVLAAQAILDQGGWCVFEVCLDVPGQHWEARDLIFDLLAEAVADTVEEEIEHEPGTTAASPDVTGAPSPPMSRSPPTCVT